MFSADILNFSKEFVYQGFNNFKFSLLSNFLFNLYLGELDDYISVLINQYSLKKKLFLNYNRKLDAFTTYLNLLNQYLPVKVDKKLNLFKNIKNLNVDKYKKFNLFYGNYVFKDTLFNKYIDYVRYLDFFLLGFIGSKNFILFVKNKITNFLKSSLHFDFKGLSLFSVQDLTYFGGYNIRLCSLKSFNYSSVSKLKSNKKYLPRVLFRLDLLRKKISKNFVRRLNSELVLHVEKIILKTGLISNFKDRKIWTYLFQLEAVRSTQFNKLLLTDDQYPLISSKIFVEMVNSSLIQYQKYSFSLYILKLQIALKDVLRSFPSVITNSILPFDLAFNNSLNEFRKRIFFFYNTSYLKKYNVNNLDSNRFFNSSFLHSFTINKFELFNLNKDFFNGKISKFQKTSNFYYFEIFFDVNYSCKKLRVLGFLHNSKTRPISNSRMLCFQDSYIIKYFGYIAFIFLNWFRCCYNFQKLIRFIEIIRESCFLTLCRKHNKTKSWSYKVYSSDLILLKGLCNNISFFPTKFVLNKMKKKILLFKKDVFFDEIFFLS